MGRLHLPPARLGVAAVAGGLLAAGLAWSPGAGGAPTVSVATDRAVYLTDAGRSVRVRVLLRAAPRGGLARPLAVRWAAGRRAAGTVTFAAGARSGATRSFTVRTARRSGAHVATRIPVRLASAQARVASASRRASIVVNAQDLPYQDPSLPVEQRVDDLVGRMTLEEQVGQMTQGERAPLTEDPEAITTLGLGSVLSGGGSTPTPNTPEAWADLVDGLQERALATRLQIPLLYGVDAVHGHNNLVGATVFPHNIGLGATRDPALVREVARATAAETRATGPQWTFAPCLCVVRDDRWGRTYESFGEDPALVRRMSVAVRGFQGPRGRDLARPDRVLATVKHFAGDGDTDYGTSRNPAGYRLDQGISITTREAFERIDIAPYVPAIQRHRAGAVMPSYSSVDWVEDGVGNPVKMHASRELLTDVLKGRLGFDGFVISDWEAISQLPNESDRGDYATQVRLGVTAGVDMFMEPFTFRAFAATLLQEVREGRVPRERVEDAVRRILRKKFELGLFERPLTDRSGLDEVGSDEHRELAREAVARSQVLLRNAGDVLPLDGDERLYVAGSNADDIGNQAGGWTVTWQGQSGDVIPGTTVLEGIREVAPEADVTVSEDASAPLAGHDVGVVVVGETPYAEGFGDVGGPRWTDTVDDEEVQREPKDLELSAADRRAVDRVCAAVPTCVVVVVAGRPQILTPQRLERIDALVAAWLPGSEGAGVADVLFGRRGFTGRLPVSWPRSELQEPVNVGDPGYDPLFRYDFGLRTRATGGAR